ncbi:hypothetical protein [Methylomonas fluvii]|nr:hypothetical protein [Methylomonas fluvii]
MDALSEMTTNGLLMRLVKAIRKPKAIHALPHTVQYGSAL